MVETYVNARFHLNLPYFGAASPGPPVPGWLMHYGSLDRLTAGALITQMMRCALLFIYLFILRLFAFVRSSDRTTMEATDATSAASSETEAAEIL